MTTSFDELEGVVRLVNVSVLTLSTESGSS